MEVSGRFAAPGCPGYYDAVQRVDRLPGEMERVDGYVLHGHAVYFEPGPVWAFYSSLESAYVLGRAATMTLDLGDVQVLRAALRVVFDHRLERDRRELMVCGDNLLQDRTGDREVRAWSGRVRRINPDRAVSAATPVADRV